ncbi:MAG: ATPase domain-containing protein [Myxococcota bacterium]
MKVRGQASVEKRTPSALTKRGLQVFPRLLERHPENEGARPATRLSTGIAGLDEMTSGGIPSGDVVLVAGPTGSGKTTVAMEFVNAGLRLGEAAVVAVFEERPREYLVRAGGLGGDGFSDAVKSGRLEVMYLRPLDLSVDETMQELHDIVTRIGARRVVIDSLSGFEVALAPTFRTDFRESLYRLLGMLTATGVTVMMTNEIVGGPTEQRFTLYQMSFLCDDIILNRLIELDGEYRRTVAVLKMRRGPHSRAIRTFEITSRGVVIGGSLPLVHAGAAARAPSAYEGLVASEANLLDALQRVGDRPARALGEECGLVGEDLERALSRLEELRYVTRSMRDREAVYTAVGRGQR